MKGIKAYGAEIRIGGFSGYLCELLVLNYGTFIRVLRAFSEWTGRAIIDYGSIYEVEQKDLERFFEEPLVVIDPVDKGRNVAGSVREEKLNEFVVAAREFLKNPSLEFFYPSDKIAFAAKDLVDLLKKRGSTIVFVRFGKIDAVPDILWGQLYKSQKGLHRVLEQHDFNIIQDSVWSNEEELNIFIFEVEKNFLPEMRRHLGPPIIKKRECERFLKKHLGAVHTVSGPRVEEGRWIIDVRREHRDVVSLLIEKLKDDGRRVGVASLVSESISEGFEILVNEEVLELYSANPEFAKSLTEYLEGRPNWLQ
jgi:tRNA nucleotidyltransferase (CCA-adding enzyme)